MVAVVALLISHKVSHFSGISKFTGAPIATNMNFFETTEHAEMIIRWRMTIPKRVGSEILPRGNIVWFLRYTAVAKDYSQNGVGKPAC